MSGEDPPRVHNVTSYVIPRTDHSGFRLHARGARADPEMDATMAATSGIGAPCMQCMRRTDTRGSNARMMDPSDGMNSLHYSNCTVSQNSR